ncbi:MAG: rod shape-determining protein MreD [bacterium]|nr:rod shape-determining protein MreD [Acidimicrobiia bacterium]MCY4650408.1 rod shape-determining protein MreD [bacterium]
MSSRFRSRRYRARRESARTVTGSLSRRGSFLPLQRSIRWGHGLAWLGVMVVAVVLQMSVMGRIQVAGVSPDLVTLVIAYAAFRVRDNGILFLGFTGGLLLDASGTAVLGLWSFSLTLVAWVAMFTREQGGRGVAVNALRILFLTLLGMVAHTVISIAFGDWSLVIWEALRRITLTPVLNFLMAVMLFPLSSRLWVPSLK